MHVTLLCDAFLGQSSTAALAEYTFFLQDLLQLIPFLVAFDHCSSSFSKCLFQLLLFQPCWLP